MERFKRAKTQLMIKLGEFEPTKDTVFEDLKLKLDQTLIHIQNVLTSIQKFDTSLGDITKPLLKLATSVNSFYEEESEGFKLYGTKYFEATSFIDEELAEYQNNQKKVYHDLSNYIKKLQSLKKDIEHRNQVCLEYDSLRSQYERQSKDQTDYSFALEHKFNEKKREYDELHLTILKKLQEWNQTRIRTFLEPYNKLKIAQLKLFGSISQRFEQLQIETSEEFESVSSILKEKDKRKQLVNSVPKKKLLPLESDQIFEIHGTPEENQSALQHESTVCAKSISTYPRSKPNSEEREGDPICDQYIFSRYYNRAFFAIADGCNWGVAPRDAAKISVKKYIELIRIFQERIDSIDEFVSISLRILLKCHEAIVSNKCDEELYSVGTTTILLGAMFEIKDQNNNVPNNNNNIDKTSGEWGIVIVSVGDCKAFKFTATGEIFEITEGNRQNVSDARDPGGRIGPHLANGNADLRNLGAYYCDCKENDVIVLLSDGVHDNFDPQLIGKTPSSYGVDIKDDSWAELEKVKGTELYIQAEKAKTQAMIQLMKQVVGDNFTPKNIATKLVNYCDNQTKSSREFMEMNPGSPLPKDYAQYPGKMDHTTCLSFSVGKYGKPLVRSNLSKFPKSKRQIKGEELP